jgi:CxxC-x17-CxxC domain-containing protein
MALAQKCLTDFDHRHISAAAVATAPFLHSESQGQSYNSSHSSCLVPSSADFIVCMLRRRIARRKGSEMSDTNGTGLAVQRTDQNSKFEDRSIECIDCHELFVWTVGEQVFFHDKGLVNEPKRCKPCKQAKNERLTAISNAQSKGIKQKIEVEVNCAKCGLLTTVPFYPSQGRPVYCRACFLAGRTAKAAGA